jgi:hypothetical protein
MYSRNTDISLDRIPKGKILIQPPFPFAYLANKCLLFNNIQYGSENAKIMLPILQ